MRPAPSPRDARLTALRRDIDSLSTQPEFRNAHWGILIVDPESGDTLYSRNAGKLFMPASNMKIITGAVALAQLGPDFRFRTAFAARGHLCGGTLHGDLVVSGRGDPSISDAMRGDALLPMREIADSLSARGIRRITGRVIAGDTAFPEARLGYGWSWDDLSEPYSAGVDELFFNEGAGRIAVAGGARAGARVTASVLPASRYPVLRIDARTAFPPESAVMGSGSAPVSASAGSALQVTLDTASRALVISGWISPGAVDTIRLAFPDQRAAYLGALGHALRERGIRVDGQTTHGAQMARGAGCANMASNGSAPGMHHGSMSALDTLFTYESLPLREILPAMEKPSQNQIAEILLRTIGLERTGIGRADSGAAIVGRQLLAWGAEPDGFIVRDGSGLSRYNYLSPETIVRTLAAIRQDTAFAAFYDALPIAGVDGTIAGRMRGTPAEGNVRAKTGFVANARSLSGYVTTADGRTLIFSALCNNWTVPVRVVERVQDAIAVRLAQLTLGRRN
jgi:D-alanyl-D-alanine carboxypeptidase/D-alanyl-D-alanine-endopeptidase (penicillin-binding protein 4)